MLGKSTRVRILSGAWMQRGLRLLIRKLICMVLWGTSIGCGEINNIETSHFRICETVPNKKFIVKYGNLTSSEFECANIHLAKVYEVSKNELLLSRAIGHGTGFNVEELVLIQVVDNAVEMNFISRIFSRKRQSFKVYTFSNEEIFKQIRKRTKFKISEGEFVVIIDDKETHRDKLNVDANYYIDYCDEYFTFDLDKQPSASIAICTKHKNEVTYSDFIGSIRFDMRYKVNGSTVKIKLVNPRFEK